MTRTEKEKRPVLVTDMIPPWDGGVLGWVRSIPHTRAVRAQDPLLPIRGRKEALKMAIERRPQVGDKGKRDEVAELLDGEARQASRARPLCDLGLRFAARRKTREQKLSSSPASYEVEEVTPFGPAARSGQLLVGDALVSLDGIPVGNLAPGDVRRMCTGVQGTQCVVRYARQSGRDGRGRACGRVMEVKLTREPMRYAVPSFGTTLGECDSASRAGAFVGNRAQADVRRGKSAGRQRARTQEWQQAERGWGMERVSVLG